ncbi:MAG: LytS/YhcK type 5TM receptor domain-containing protein [Chloroflexota bacterium]|nr:LytS/YhcK type 5TM receptor domain-containing protein [Chloroflexota bacterium]
MFQDLMTNAALLIGLSSLYGLLGQFREKLYWWHNVLTGLLFGAIAIAGMSVPVQYSEGIIYDGRSIVLTLVGLFGRGRASLIAALMAGIFRASLGGTGVWAGLATIVACSAFGLLIRRATGNRPEKLSIPAL